MVFHVFLTFDGECRAALKFYASVFDKDMPKDIMTYGQNPAGSAEADKDRILYACLPLSDVQLMLSDCPSGFKSIKGNNIMLTIGLDNENDLRKIFTRLSEGGKIDMPLGKTFFNELFGMVTDKFGIIWQINSTCTSKS